MHCLRPVTDSLADGSDKFSGRVAEFRLFSDRCEGCRALGSWLQGGNEAVDDEHPAAVT